MERPFTERRSVRSFEVVHRLRGTLLPHDPDVGNEKVEVMQWAVGYPDGYTNNEGCVAVGYN